MLKLKRSKKLVAMAGLLLSSAWCAGQFACNIVADTHASAVAVKEERAVLDGLLTAKPGPVQIAAGDLVEVRIFNVKAYEANGRVSPEGTLVFPLLGELHVAFATVAGLTADLKKRLEDGGMIRDPQVSVTISESPTQRATVSGEVAKPGTYPINGDHTLIELISMAQGFKDTANHTVMLYRSSLPEGVAVPLGPSPKDSRFANIPVFAGDTVTVSKIGVIYVVGAVKTSGTYPLKDTTPTTVVQAVTMAGGPGYEAAKGDVHLVRCAGTDKQQEIHIDYQKIIQGKAKDPVLQADDILLLPTDKMKAAVKGGGAGLAVSLATALLYLH